MKKKEEPEAVSSVKWVEANARKKKRTAISGANAQSCDGCHIEDAARARAPAMGGMRAGGATNALA